MLCIKGDGNMLGFQLKRSIYIRLMITFMIILLPIYLISIAFYNWAETSTRNDIENSLNNQTSYYFKNLENDILRIRKLQNNLLMNDDLQKLTNLYPLIPNKYEKTQSIIRLQQMLYAVYSSSIIIEKVKVQIPSADLCIDANGSVSRLENEEYDYFSRLMESSYYSTVYWKDGYYLITPFSITEDGDNNEVLFLCEVKLSTTELEKAMKNLNAYKSCGSLLIDRDTGGIIVSDNDNYISKVIIDKFKVIKKSDNENGILRINHLNTSYILAFSDSKYLGMTFIKYIIEDEVFKDTWKLKIWFWIFCILSVFIIFVFSLAIFRFISNPMKKLVNSFKKAEMGELQYNISYTQDDEFGYLFSAYNRMTDKINEMIEQVYSQKLLVQKAEYQHLQTQINPHFLYNSFFVLQRMIQGADIDQASLFAEYLGSYFRYITRNQSEEVPLAAEVKHARIYTQIQGMRYMDSIKIEFEELPTRYKQLMVPRIILQPLVENAFKYGLKTREENGEVHISFHTFSKELHVIVEDNGTGINDEKLKELNMIMNNELSRMEITGMANIHKRMQIKYGDSAGLAFMKGELGGLKILLKIPLQEDRQDV
jgi:two-component system sensor histidine kinase YesM